MIVRAITPLSGSSELQAATYQQFFTNIAKVLVQRPLHERCTRWACAGQDAPAKTNAPRPGAPRSVQGAESNGRSMRSAGRSLGRVGELLLFRRALQRRRGRGARGDCLRDAVEVAGADFALMLCR